MSSPFKDELTWLFSTRQHLPAQPESAIRLAACISPNQIDPDALCDIILSDPGLTVTLLKAANENCETPCTNVRTAVASLSSARLRTISGSAMKTSLALEVSDQSHFSVERYLSAGPRIGASLTQLEPRLKHYAMTIAVLSQVPLGVCRLVASDYFSSAWMAAKAKSTSFESEFQAQTGVSVFELGSLTLTKFGMPPELSQTIAAIDSPKGTSQLGLVRHGVDLLGYGTTPWPVAWPQSHTHYQVLDACIHALELQEAA